MRGQQGLVARCVVTVVLIAACGGGDDGGSVVVDGRGAADAPVDAGHDASVDAGGGDDSDQGVYQAGNRLEPRFLGVAGGPRRPIGLYDRELRIMCNWVAGSPARCLPEHRVTHMFLDAACTEPVYERGTDCQMPALVGTQTDACGPWWEPATSVLYPVEPIPLPAPATSYRYERTTGACIEVETTLDTQFFALGEPLDLSIYATGHQALVGTGAIQTRTIIGDDGSWTPRGAYDTTLGVACRATSTEGCVPVVPGAYHFADTTCGTPAAAWRTACETPPYMIGVDEFVGTSALFAWDADAIAGPGPFASSRLVEAACSPGDVMIGPGFTLHRPGPVVPVAFAPSSWEVVGAGTLREYRFIAGAHSEHSQFYDPARAGICHPKRQHGGGWWCLPYLPEVFTGYLDPACTMPIEAITGLLDPVDPTTAVRRIAIADCGEELEPVVVGAALPEYSLYHREADGLCYPTSALHVLGGPGSFAAFPALAELGP